MALLLTTQLSTCVRSGLTNQPAEEQSWQTTDSLLEKLAARPTTQGVRTAGTPAVDDQAECPSVASLVHFNLDTKQP